MNFRMFVVVVLCNQILTGVMNNVVFDSGGKDFNGPGEANFSGYTQNHPAGPPPYSSYPPGPPPPGPPPIQVTTMVPGLVIQQAVGPGPMLTRCRSCNQNMVSRVEKKASTKTHIFAAALCLFGCWPCVCIPYCTDSCLNTDHYCTNCGAFIGTYY